eukprot:gene4537-6407_t
MSSGRALLTSLLLSFFISVLSSNPIEISVTYDSKSNSYSVSDKADLVYADSFGYYYKNYNGNGWNYLDVYMQMEVDSIDDHITYSKSMGYLEGFITCNEIKSFYPNFYSATFGTDKVGSKTLGFVKANYDWMSEMAAKLSATDDYWYTVKSTLLQLEGLYEGYVAGCGTSNVEKIQSENPYSTLDNPTLEHFLLINAWGDLYQISKKWLEPGHNARMRGNKLKNNKEKLVERCSAIIKFLPDKSDVVFGHNTWDSYESLGPRIIKHYNFPLMRSGYAEHHYDIYFSSSPALLSSVDDFFLISGYSQLGVMETTNSLYNLKSLDLVIPQSVLSWQRAIASHQLASSGANWAQVFSRYHSGTYTNQWMVLDLKLFTPKQALPKGFLTVYEEVPGLDHYEDQTNVLNNEGYWGSYNSPVYEDIIQASGYGKACEINVDNCHNTAPRALLFKKYQNQIVDIQGAQWILGYNSFQNDTESKNDSCDTIACRGDLEPKEASIGAFGALDAKVTSVTGAKRYPGIAPQFYARYGTTHDQQQVFCWSTFADESSYSHNGQPDCFDYTWESFPPPNPAIIKI